MPAEETSISWRNSRFFGLYDRYPPMNRVVASANQSELCYSPKPDWDCDPRFFYFNEPEHDTDSPMMAVIGQTGIVERVVLRDGKKQRDLLVRSNAFGNFQQFDDARDPASILQVIYEDISGMKFHEGYFKRFFHWDDQRVLARFRKFGNLYSDRDIVPEFNDTMMIVKVSDGCPRRCIYCPEPATNVALYDEAKVKANIRKAKTIVEEFHSNHMDEMTELFINGSDLLWSHVLSGEVDLDIVGEFLGDKINRSYIASPSFRNAIDPRRVVELCREQFPWVEKVYAFAGVPTVLATQADNPRYLSRLFDGGYGINRWLIGIESFHPEVSKMLGKKESALEKACAISALQDSGAKVKPIIQVGMIGRGYYSGGKFISSWDDVKVTLEHLVNVCRKITCNDRDDDKVIISEYLDVPGTPLARMHAEGRIVKAEPGLVQRQMNWLHRQLRLAGIAVDLNYQPALENRKRVEDSQIIRAR